MKRKSILFLLLISCCTLFAFDKQALTDTLTAYANQEAHVGKVHVKRVRVKKNNVAIYTNRALSFISLKEENVRALYRLCSNMVLGHDRGKVQIFTDDYEISDLILDSKRHGTFTLPTVSPLVSNVSRTWNAPNGLDGKHVVVYGSHGIYFQQTRAWWMWQRARVLTTVEDLYTTSYVRPFLVPMLENAGAVVIQPRERDTQLNEVIVDNSEIHAATWQTSADSTGWAHPTGYLHEGDNPFTFGNYLSTVGKSAQEATSLQFTPTIPEEGEYAVYVSYKSLPNSTNKAEYTVVHKGIKTRFNINQQMGGSTWVYVGTFAFDANDKENNYVSISNRGGAKQVITADAVRFGGGMGSIERYRNPETVENAKSDDAAYINQLGQAAKDSIAPIDWSTASISGFPRYIEAARYWMQYSGIPDSVYNYTQSKNDYIDDYTCRGRWVNYLAGGSAAHPDSVGLGIPIHAGLAFHTDAGTTMNDDIIGTLLIHTTWNNDNKKTFPVGSSRLLNRDYAEYMQTQITEDIQRTFAPEWQRRRNDNSSYSEARNPEVPMVLLELLSHQNFADMRYGLDPRFRFVVSRAIYKSIVRFINHQYDLPAIIQPLPVKDFAIALKDSNLVNLSWKETVDSLEETAHPEYYIVYSRKDNGDWDNGVRVKTAEYQLALERGHHYDFRVQAGNKGGLSMLSETLSAGLALQADAPKVLIINGFTRVSAPENFVVDSTIAGFNPNEHGVPYGKAIHYIGAQYEFDRTKPWVSDDDAGFGASYLDQACTIMAGNTFDYPALHGQALLQAGYSYVSTSVNAVDSICSDFAAVDFILGKQKPTTIGTEKVQTDFSLYPVALQKALKAYQQAGGNILVSGAYVARFDGDKEAQQFAKEVLHYEYRTENATHNGKVMTLGTLGTKKAQLRTEPNETIFHAENVTGVTPVGETANTVARYIDSGVCAAAAYEGVIGEKAVRTLVFGFPLESVEEFDTIYLQAIRFVVGN